MKSTLLLSLCLIILQTLIAQKQKSYKINYLDDLSLFYLLDNKKLFAEEQLANLSSQELKYLRNLPFAKKGMLFKDSTFFQYFKKYTWYKPTKTTVAEIELNQQEKDNIALITVFENAIKIPIADANYINILSGHWQLYTTTVASGYNDIFHFDSIDKSFAFYANQMSTSAILKQYSGWFVLKKDTIELDISSKIVKQKFYKKDKINPVTKKQYKVAEYRDKEINLDEAHEFKAYAISEITQIVNDNISKMFLKIDGKVYWKIIYRVSE